MSLHTASTQRILSSFVHQHLHAGPGRLAITRVPPQSRAQVGHSFSSRVSRRPTPLGNRSTSRPFSSTPRASNSTNPNTSFPDPERSDLFYHLFEAPNDVSRTSPVFALSFLPTPPPSVQSCTVIGWLPASTPGGKEEDAGLNDFVENPLFRDVLHGAVQGALRDGVDDVQKNGAIQTQVGWMHVHDQRNVPALGRIGDVDDILASVRVEDGEILPSTYQPMPSYRLCTGDGLTQLTEGLAARLKEILEDRAAKGQ
ncbi:uncharacterized protein C8Q71DRAFT_444591 [Rhodofomes roseus]|uniref:Uncharacterized protein n=1 Tax=Rhodofomes roseus TaxID=34475 RepID=A0A4Y9Y4X4_9APHY|nr:uncharacterized protein C8Q71DRAFT_444591 [Rhodofomes roseus]KAH9829256.1 hypothetical protein C8Q71DRAFT_444591 [Rhodofomes roseus]TFY57506.1 hypothetical protein EVJ58_g6980 [Rhodofomes roseus]